jgi:hypothetical protein
VNVTDTDVTVDTDVENVTDMTVMEWEASADAEDAKAYVDATLIAWTSLVRLGIHSGHLELRDR